VQDYLASLSRLQHAVPLPRNLSWQRPPEPGEKNSATVVLTAHCTAIVGIAHQHSGSCEHPIPAQSRADVLRSTTAGQLMAHLGGYMDAPGASAHGTGARLAAASPLGAEAWQAALPLQRSTPVTAGERPVFSSTIRAYTPKPKMWIHEQVRSKL